MKTQTLKQLAAQIEQDFPDLVAIVYKANHPLGGFCNTDRKIGRLRHPGKGRRGSRLMVSRRGGRPPCTEAEHDFKGIGPHLPTLRGTFQWPGLRAQRGGNIPNKPGRGGLDPTTEGEYVPACHTGRPS